MKADVQPRAEKEALEWAIEYFRTRILHLTAAGGGKFAMKAILGNMPPERREGTLSVLAERFDVLGDLAAAEILGAVAAMEIAAGRPLIGTLRSFALGRMLHPLEKFNRANSKWEEIKSKPGPSKFDQIARNSYICLAIEHIVDKWGIAATRNPGTNKHSAASIVRDALERARVGVNKTEAAINKIWLSRPPKASEKIAENP
jgi:hypothetical protein